MVPSDLRILLLFILSALLPMPSAMAAPAEFRFVGADADLVTVADMKAARDQPAAWAMLEQYLPPEEQARLAELQGALGVNVRRDADQLLLSGPSRNPDAMVAALTGRFDPKAIGARAAKIPGYKTGKLSGLPVHAIPSGGGILVAFPSPGIMLLASEFTAMEKAIATGAAGGVARKVGGAYPTATAGRGAPILWLDGIEPDLAMLALPPAIAGLPLDRATLGMWLKGNQAALDGKLRARDAESANRIALGLKGLAALSWMQAEHSDPLSALLAQSEVRAGSDPREVLVTGSALWP